MFLAITGGVLVGGVGLAALYDYIAKKHGKNVSISASGPFMDVGTQAVFGPPRALPSDSGTPSDSGPTDLGSD
jgi:hypothetical protein